ncbi:DnaJ protein, putative [Plasmodium sp. gorilla clade G2]|uniref:DnaJ protein, putative n=1 Tax=Plasmodium sp. gorilla clade G2 TaxID=880535 RepID=UPI000D2A5A69|nr:DnaJ protein, putative [Plasmodium sp. gorilla clade G2]SOV20443.1 DnaJ protein, putative [Plasmodium sp. gorilla clade G2]
MRNLTKLYSKLNNKYVPIFPFDNNRNRCKKSVLLKCLSSRSNFLLTSGIILYIFLLIINLYDARYASNFIVICDRNLSETSSSKSSGNYNERLFEINNLSNTQNNGITYDKESNDLFKKRENYPGNFNNDDISKRSIKSKTDVGCKESNISKKVGDSKIPGRTNKVIESDVLCTMMSSLETIDSNKNIKETVPNVSKKSKKDVESKKVNKCKKSEGLNDINESRKTRKKNVSTKSNNNNNLSVENEKDSVSESFEKVWEDHMKEGVFLDGERDTSHRKETDDEKEHKRNDYEEEKKKNDFDKRRKNVSSPDNRFEHPDTTYYDILNVSPDADSSEIKKSYYKLALEYHPDKNPGDEEAKVKFQKVNEAYQILSDKEKRAQYDSIGMQCVDDVTLIDPSLLFMMLFSSEKLCDYIGVYDLTYMFNFIMRSMNEGHANGIIFNMFGFMNKFFDKFKKDQEDREFDLAVSLKYRLEGYVNGDDNWEKQLENEIGDLLESNFSGHILESVGWIYENVAKCYILKNTTFMGWGARSAKKEYKKRYKMNYKCVFRSIFNTMGMLANFVMNPPPFMIDEGNKNYNNMTQIKSNESTSNNCTICSMSSNRGPYSLQNIKRQSDYNNKLTMETYMKKIFDSLMSTIVTLFLNIIEGTVRTSCKMVLIELDVDKDTLFKRAEGMKLLGEKMQKLANIKKRESENKEMDSMDLIEKAIKEAKLKMKSYKTEN